MKHIKTYESFNIKVKIKESNHYQETHWTRDIDGEEVTITIHDVEDYLKSKNVKPIDINVDEIADMCAHKDKKDEATLKRAQSADLSFPIIIAKHKGDWVMILDGHHRLKKAIDNNLETIKAKVLNLDDAPYDYKKMFV